MRYINTSIDTMGVTHINQLGCAWRQNMRFNMRFNMWLRGKMAWLACRTIKCCSWLLVDIGNSREMVTFQSSTLRLLSSTPTIIFCPMLLVATWEAFSNIAPFTPAWVRCRKNNGHTCERWARSHEIWTIDYGIARIVDVEVLVDAKFSRSWAIYARVLVRV